MYHFFLMSYWSGIREQLALERLAGSAVLALADVHRGREGGSGSISSLRSLRVLHVEWLALQAVAVAVVEQVKDLLPLERLVEHRHGDVRLVLVGGNGMTEVAVGASLPSPVTVVLLSPLITSAAAILPFPFSSLALPLFTFFAAAPIARAGVALPKTTGVQWSTNAPIGQRSCSRVVRRTCVVLWRTGRPAQLAVVELDRGDVVKAVVVVS